eukprot:1009496_1
MDSPISPTRSSEFVHRYAQAIAERDLLRVEKKAVEDRYSGKCTQLKSELTRTRAQLADSLAANNALKGARSGLVGSNARTSARLISLEEEVKELRRLLKTERLGKKTFIETYESELTRLTSQLSREIERSKSFEEARREGGTLSENARQNGVNYGSTNVPNNFRGALLLLNSKTRALAAVSQTDDFYFDTKSQLEVATGLRELADVLAVLARNSGIVSEKEDELSDGDGGSVAEDCTQNKTETSVSHKQHLAVSRSFSDFNTLAKLLRTPTPPQSRVVSPTHKLGVASEPTVNVLSNNEARSPLSKEGRQEMIQTEESVPGDSSNTEKLPTENQNLSEKRPESLNFSEIVPQPVPRSASDLSDLSDLRARNLLDEFISGADMIGMGKSVLPVRSQSALATRKRSTSKSREQRALSAVVPSLYGAQTVSSRKRDKMVDKYSDYSAIQEAVFKRLLRTHPDKYSTKSVDQAVMSLKRTFLKLGIDLPMYRVGDCCYQLWSKKLHLNVYSGVLHVRTGGGFITIMDYLDHYRH